MSRQRGTGAGDGRRGRADRGQRVQSAPRPAARRRQADRPAGQPPPVLAVVLAATSAAARAEFRGLVASAARPGERLLVLSAATGAAIGSYVAPAAPMMTGPAFPAALPPDASQLQRAQYRQRTHAAEVAAARDERALAATQQHQLADWASRATTAALSAAGPMPDAARMGTAIADAVASAAALPTAKSAPGMREVLAIVGAARSRRGCRPASTASRPWSPASRMRCRTPRGRRTCCKAARTRCTCSTRR